MSFNFQVQLNKHHKISMDLRINKNVLIKNLMSYDMAYITFQFFIHNHMGPQGVCGSVGRELSVYPSPMKISKALWPNR